jgi:tetrahydromethanopterin S-methyltransferase subunit G
VSSDVVDHGWERTRFDRLEKRLDAIERKLDEIHDERERAKGARTLIIQIGAIVSGLLGGGWIIIQIVRVFVHGL